MADEATPSGPEQDDAATTPTDAPADDSGQVSGQVSGNMSEQQIRDAGLAIDVPFESGQPQPERLRYSDLGMKWTPPDGWPPDAGQPQDEDDPNA